MSEPEPAIIQGDHPFKVEAVLSKTGGVNALAKHAPDLQKAQDIGLDHRASIPPDALDSDHRVHLDSQASGDSPAQGPLRQEQYDTQHREQFTDPSRRIQPTNASKFSHLTVCRLQLASRLATRRHKRSMLQARASMRLQRLRVR